MPGSDKAQKTKKRPNTHVPSQSQSRYAQDDEDYVDSDFFLSGTSLSAVESEDKMELTENLDPNQFGDTVRFSVCLYKDVYVCDGKKDAKGPLVPCSKNGCLNTFHFDCIKAYLECMEGTDDSSWEDYNNLCHDCFTAKFTICKKQHIGYQNSEFDVTKKTDKKEEVVKLLLFNKSSQVVLEGGLLIGINFIQISRTRIIKIPTFSKTS